MILSFLRHGSNAALLLCLVSLAAAGATGQVAMHPGLIVGGALLFYISEYFWHRFAFHAPPARIPWVHRLQRRLHYDHHVTPDRLDLLFLPIWFLVPNLVVTSAVLAAVVGPERVPPLLLGIVIAILHYEWVHYVAHIPYQPKTRFGRWMKAYHLRHHFISEKLWFGVSNPTLDALGGTWRSPRGVEKSATVRNLFG